MLIRAFIAIELSPPIQKQLEQIVLDLQQTGSRHVKWVRPENIHLTLKFLGESQPDELDRLSAEIRPIASAARPIELKIHGLGAFPNFKRPRVIWVGVQAPPSLIRLQQALEDAAEKIGYPREERPFSPHLTLGRVNREASPAELARLGETIAQKPVGTLGSMTASQLILFRSVLKPAGAIYTPLAHFPLNG
ncbi:RNA 2',3'-cyclic phosphodiesterase [Bellilinea sp.]|jgi:2'-5' RNA ligase|uniref:RNA 2',3'-cyclic phosphodiesterase n=1 Tax=Bellilinea sp. TaxID=2838785 RepID=UPI002ADDB991|nr:RNA 2',3'-cyclic phosphodiesterase [Bellilinea sp.]